MSAKETADEYPGVVTILNAGWRVITCRDRLQWILQRRGSPESTRADDWRRRAFCRTSEALRRCTREYAGPVRERAAMILAGLPERLEAAVMEEV
jgi:hypothetical protein